MSKRARSGVVKFVKSSLLLASLLLSVASAVAFVRTCFKSDELTFSINGEPRVAVVLNTGSVGFLYETEQKPVGRWLSKSDPADFKEGRRIQSPLGIEFVESEFVGWKHG